MDTLNGKCVNVVLAIEMGRGLSFLDHPLKIVATFHGRPLQSDLVKQEDSPVFNTELVWEIEKKELKKVRSTNSPLRVEIQTCDENDKNERVGFVLLSTRSAKIISYGSHTEIEFKWYKLLGISADNKRMRPELYLSLTIRDLAVENEKDVPHLIDIAVDESESLGEETVLADGTSISLSYLEDGFIQIGGEEQCCEKYLLTIVIQEASNLNLLLPYVLLYNASRAKYFISFNMFGITIKSKPFSRDLHANIPMNEKIFVRIVSEYNIIRQYLSEHCQIMISFYCGSDKVGITKLNVQPLLENINETEFKSLDSTVWCEQKCFFSFSYEHGFVPTGQDGREPYIAVATTLKQIESQDTLSKIFSIEEQEVESVSEPSSTQAYNEEATSESFDDPTPVVKNSPPNASEVVCGDELARNSFITEEEKEVVVANPMEIGAGDQNEFLYLELNDVSYPKKVQSAQNLTTRSVTMSVTESCKSADTALRNVPPLMSVIGSRKSDNNETTTTHLLYQQYCLDVIIEKISLKKSMDYEELCIKFKHPKAATESSICINTETRIGEDVLLEDARCKMFYISTKDNIRKMVYAWPPKLTLTDNTDKNLTGELDIYTAMFLSKDRFECSYTTECKSIRTYEPLAKISVTMYLQEYGLCAVPEETNFMLLPPILDEFISIKEMQELQSWKDNQKVQYTADLKILQKQRLNTLNDNWNEKKIKMEETLKQSVKKCEALSAELQTAINNLKTRKALQRKENEIKAMGNYTFEDLVDKNKLKYSEHTPPELIMAISKLERDNDNLKKIIDDQRAEVEQIKKTALTKEQTGSLLQQLRGLEEKFESAQKAKTYFKDQWQKAVREIHDLKAEDQKEIQERIQNQKIELSQLSLESFISDRATRSFDYSQGSYPTLSQTTFGAYKLDNSAAFSCLKNS